MPYCGMCMNHSRQYLYRSIFVEELDMILQRMYPVVDESNVAAAGQVSLMQDRTRGA